MSTKDLEQQLRYVGSKFGYNNLRVRLNQQNSTVILTWKDDQGIIRFKIEEYVVPKTNSYYCETYLAMYLNNLIKTIEAFGNI